MLRAEHKNKWYQGADIHDAEEFYKWKVGKQLEVYNFKVPSGYSWIYVNIPTNEIAQKFKLEQIFSGKIKKKRVKFLWKTESWKVMG